MSQSKVMRDIVEKYGTREEVQRTKRSIKWMSLLNMALFVAIAVVIVLALPNAIDQMFYEQYELPVKQVNSIQ